MLGDEYKEGELSTIDKDNITNVGVDINTSKNHNNNNALSIVNRFLHKLQSGLNSKNINAVVELFDANDSYWRDLLMLTWNIYTAEGPKQIEQMLESTIHNVDNIQFEASEGSIDGSGVVNGVFKFNSKLGAGEGYVRLHSNTGLCWTLLTSMVELTGFQERKNKSRIKGTVHKINLGTSNNWLDNKNKLDNELGIHQQPYCLIIGSGQGGLALGARLKQLNVPTLIVDKHKRPGDQWRGRYKSLCLHDPVWYDHLPYIKFPDNWPVFSPKDKIGDWLECYARLMELNIWNSTTCDKAVWDEHNNEWNVYVTREGETHVIKPKQLIFATGMSGVPCMPSFKGMDKFLGKQHHSSQHGSGADYAGKKVVVVGSNNSAHDICGDLWANGADVTMLQRTSTCVIKCDTLMEYALGDLYSERALDNGITVEKADLINASIPYRVMPSFHKPVYKKIREIDSELYNRLEKAGFMIDFGDDDTGVFMKYLRRGSGYYFDVGCCELICNGDIKLKSRVEIEEIKPHSIVLNNGEEIPADVIVYATGYNSMNGWVAKIINEETADRVGKVWGLGSNTTKDPGPWVGEPRNMWKPTTVDNLWFHGGNLAQSRFYSQHLALQIKARYENIPTPVYGIPKVYHKQ